MTNVVKVVSDWEEFVANSSFSFASVSNCGVLLFAVQFCDGNTLQAQPSESERIRRQFSTKEEKGNLKKKC